MVGQLLRRPAEDLTDRGFTEAAGGRGDCSLHAGLDGTLREVAGGPRSEAGWLAWSSGEYRGSLGVGTNSGPKVTQVFGVKFGSYGGRGGLMSGALERWESGEFLGGVWKEAAGWSDGNCERKELGCRSGDRGVSGWF